MLLPLQIYCTVLFLKDLTIQQVLVYARYPTIYRLNYVPYNVISWDISIHKFIQSQKTETKTLLLEQYQKLSNVLLHRTILSNNPIEVKSKYKIVYKFRWKEFIAKVIKGVHKQNQNSDLNEFLMVLALCSFNFNYLKNKTCISRRIMRQNLSANS